MLFCCLASSVASLLLAAFALHLLYSCDFCCLVSFFVLSLFFFLGDSWQPLGRSSPLLGRSWPLLGRSWGALGLEELCMLVRA